MSRVSSLVNVAGYYLPGKLVDVRVVDLSAQALRGLAYNSESGYCVILLDPSCVDDGETFFHELAHHVLGHPIGAISQEVAYAPRKTVSELSLPVQEKIGLEDYLAKIEIEADTWAERELANFERSLGSFAEVLFGAPAGGDGEAV